MNNLLIFSVLVVLALVRGTISCQAHRRNFSEYKPILVESFKKKLLQELGLTSVPNITKLKVPRVPQYFRHLVEAENKKFNQRAKEVDDDDDFHAKTKQVFLFPKAAVVPIASPLGKYYLFESKPSHSHLEIISATLWVHIREKKPQSTGRSKPLNYEVRFFKDLPGPATGENRRWKRFLSQRLNSTGWHAFQLTGLVKKWFAQPGSNLTLKNHIVGGNGSLEVGGPRAVDGLLQPFLVADTKEASRRRKKRRVSIRNCAEPPDGTCCLHEFWIDFQEMGWDFVVYPDRVKTNACSGNCDSLAFYKNLYRADVSRKTYFKSHNCCVPETMGAISIIYYDINESRVVLKNITNVVAKSCQCIV